MHEEKALLAPLKAPIIRDPSWAFFVYWDEVLFTLHDRCLLNHSCCSRCFAQHSSSSSDVMRIGAFLMEGINKVIQRWILILANVSSKTGRKTFQHSFQLLSKKGGMPLPPPAEINYNGEKSRILEKATR